MLIEDAARLAKIDHLYSLRLDQYVSLPVLVVVGDQSSGKSSVLEALTGLPFPRDSTLCTRFPTQIVFKRSPQRHVEVSILPTADTTQTDNDLLHKFTTTMSRHNSSQLKSEELLDILRKASQTMGLTDGTNFEEEEIRSFSNDLLKIELSGPDYDHFSVIDLPGLFRKPTSGQTTKEDMLLVRNLVSAQLKNERSIVLAVVPANVDIATQEIIQMAEDADPDRKRTLAVLTKPDLVDKGAEEHIVALVNQSSSRSGLGYVVVCNRSQRELDISLAERNANERAFLCQAPWDAISQDRAGVVSLKQRLNALAVHASRQSFERVGLEITNRLKNARKRLSALGRPRHTVEAQRLFLLQLSSEYQGLINKATDGYYGRDECFRRHSSLRLATMVMEENEKFSKVVAKKGSYRVFSDDQGSDTGSEVETSEALEPITSGGDMAEVLVPKYADGTGYDQVFPELTLILSIDRKDPVQSEEPVSVWIARTYHDFRGFEMGGPNPSLITALVYEQTSSWSHHAHVYVGNVIRRIHRCIHDLLRHLCHDLSVFGRLWTFLLPRLQETYLSAVKHTDFLVEVERHGYPITLNHYFAQTMDKRRRARLEKRLGKMKSWQTNDDDRQPLLRLDDVLKSYASNEEYRTEELEDVLQSYHKVARKRFVDNVCKQVVDHMLICSKRGPLHIFSAQTVGILKEDELQNLAGEDESISGQRAKLHSEVEILEKGQKVLA